MILKNISIVNTPTDHDIEILSYVLPMRRQVFWSFLFGLVVLVAVAGNTIVIWIVMAHKNMRTVTNYFIVNLALADILVTSLNVMFSFYYMLVANWPFGGVYCKVSEFIAKSTMCASVLTLLAICVDRYTVIMRLSEKQVRQQTILLVMVIIWMLSFILSYPNWIYYTMATQQFANGGLRNLCYSQWPGDDKTGQWHQYLYYITFVVVTYFVPIFVMAFTYGRILVKLRKAQNTGDKPRIAHNDRVLTKTKNLKMIIVVVVMFGVFWLPYHIFIIVTKSTNSLLLSSQVQEIYLVIFWVAMSNSMCHPIIYYWLNSKFRNGFRKALRWIPGVTYPSGAHPSSTGDDL